MTLEEVCSFCESLGFTVTWQKNYGVCDIFSRSCIFEHGVPGTNRLFSYNSAYNSINFFGKVCKHPPNDKSKYTGSYFLAYSEGVLTLEHITRKLILDVNTQIKAAEKEYIREQIRGVDVECQKR